MTAHHRNQRLALRAAALVLLGTPLLPACSAETSSPQATVAQERPVGGKSGQSLHAVYWGRTVREDGDPDAIRDYRERVRLCEEAGMAVKPLAESDVEKLGKDHYERWMDESRNVLVIHSWELGISPRDSIASACQFSLQEKKYVEGLNNSWEIHPTRAEALASIHEDNIAAGWVRKGRKTVLGQPCVVWEKGGNRLCLLDAPELGFTDSVAVHDDCATTGGAGVESRLPLEQVQAPEKRNCEFKVELIEIGQPLDASQWQAAAKGAE